MKKTTIIISMLLICLMFTGTLKIAKAAEYTSKEISYPFNDFERFYTVKS